MISTDALLQAADRIKEARKQYVDPRGNVAVRPSLLVVAENALRDAVEQIREMQKRLLETRAR